MTHPHKAYNSALPGSEWVSVATLSHYSVYLIY